MKVYGQIQAVSLVTVASWRSQKAPSQPGLIHAWMSLGFMLADLKLWPPPVTHERCGKICKSKALHREEWGGNVTAKCACLLEWSLLFSKVSAWMNGDVDSSYRRMRDYISKAVKWMAEDTVCSHTGYSTQFPLCCQPPNSHNMRKHGDRRQNFPLIWKPEFVFEDKSNNYVI